ncbi:MAG: flagellar basal body rod protein FlgB [Syntrophomonadaceae bacterium]|nr:flagellar basal body rod protein FlgB [Syntrophomonadaceae bacterium]
MDRFFQSPAAAWLEKGLDATSLRHRVLANNLANAETPNFKRSEVSFEAELKDRLREKKCLPLVRTHPQHRPNIQPVSQIVPSIKTDISQTMRNDGNNVDIDAEMAKLTINTIQYNTLIQQLGSHFARLRSVINEGRR